MGGDHHISPIPKETLKASKMDTKLLPETGPPIPRRNKFTKIIESRYNTQQNFERGQGFG
jgi:hypothetical protein